MAADLQLLYVGYVSDFIEGTGPALPILGDTAGFLWLGNIIESRWVGKLSLLSPRVILANIGLNLAYSESHPGLMRSGAEFNWTLSNSSSKMLPGLLRGLAASDGPGHAYLDGPLEAAGIQVVASKGEYDPATLLPGASWAR